jgi:arylsulfatase A-like enzyme
MGVDACPGYATGSVKPNMPNLSKMINEGITFDNVWAYPVCSPTRSSIFSGKYGYRTGVLNVDDASTIPADEKSLHTYIDEQTGNAYSHSIIGKWHLSGREASRPTDMGVGHYAGLLTGAVQDYFSWSLTENSQTNTYDGYVTTKFTDLAIDWINDQDKPWFCWLAYTAPHSPFHLPPDSMHTQNGLPSDTASINANPQPYYMAMLESLDFEIGRLLDAIPENELENTVIVFLGDNGTPGQVIQSPYDRTTSKGSLYQGGIHVPMIISGAGVNRMNEHEDQLISSVDLFSTLAQLAGSAVPGYFDSKSFASLLSVSTETERKYVYSEVLNSTPNRSGFAIRNHQYKLIRFDNGNERFYDLNSDAFEANNLLTGNLNSQEQSAYDELVAEANNIRK